VQLNSAGPEVEAPRDFGDRERLRTGNRFVVVAPAVVMKEHLRIVPLSPKSAAEAAVRQREQELAMEFEVFTHDPAADTIKAGKGSRAKRQAANRPKQLPAALVRVVTNEDAQAPLASTAVPVLETAAAAATSTQLEHPTPSSSSSADKSGAWASLTAAGAAAGAGAGSSGFTLSLPAPASARGSERLKRPPQNDAYEYTDVQAREDGELPRPRHRRKGHPL